MRRKRFSAWKRPTEAQRRIMSAPRQRFTLRDTRRMEPTRFSMLLVVARERLSVIRQIELHDRERLLEPFPQAGRSVFVAVLSSHETRPRSFLRAVSAETAR